MKSRRSFLTFSLGALLALVSLVTSSRIVAEEGPANERTVWKERCEKVKVGMTRAEAEKILPPYQPVSAGKELLILPYTARVVTGTGSRQAIRYYVSPGWCVVVTYDYTGVARDASGTATEYASPENKVLGPVELQYRLEPEAKPLPKSMP
jgi:hypothetical protein